MAKTWLNDRKEYKYNDLDIEVWANGRHAADDIFEHIL